MKVEEMTERVKTAKTTEQIHLVPSGCLGIGEEKIMLPGEEVRFHLGDRIITKEEAINKLLKVKFRSTEKNLLECF